MSEVKKVRDLMWGVKKQLFAGLVCSPPKTVADFVREATTIERALQQRNMQYGREANLAAFGLPINDEKALRELVRSVVCEELWMLQRGDGQLTFAAVTDVIRNEVRRAMAPVAPPAVEHPIPKYTDVLRIPVAAVEHHAATYMDVLRTLVSARHSFCPLLEPFRPILSQATWYEPRWFAQNAVVWRTSDNRPLCYHCGEARHILRHCPYHRMRLRGFSPNTP